MAGKLPMGSKELIWGKLLEMVWEETLTLKTASVRMKVSYRQAKRLYARYRAKGDAGLIHQSTGRPSNRRTAAKERDRILERYRTKYEDFGPTFASEKLLEDDGFVVNRETLRRWLLEEDLWAIKRRRNPYRSRRPRRKRFGELVQFDGSPHDWFEGRRTGCCLMNMVDDATGTTLSFLCEEETTDAAMRLLWAWIERFGIPQALYGDRKNAFVTNREPSIEEQLKAVTPETHFERACRRLGIEVIVAYSPQAKGRVERNHAVYQDRFVKELRLAGISTIEKANVFLEKKYLPKINAKFARKPEEPEDAHVSIEGAVDLRDVFCFEETRVLSQDFVLSFETILFQVLQGHGKMPHPGNKITVRKWLDGSLHFIWEEKRLQVMKIERRPEKEVENPLSA